MQPVASYGYGRQKAKNPACPSPRHASSGWHGVTTNRFERLSNDLGAYLAPVFSLMAWASSSLTHIKIWDFSTVST